MTTLAPTNPRSPLGRLIQERLLAHGPMNKQTMHRIIQETIEEYNRSSRDELAGLSPEQVPKLLSSDYISEDSVVKLNPDIPFERLKDHELLNNARNFLSLLQLENGTKATSYGYLNRAFVAKAIKVMVFPEEYLEKIYRVKKVINETDVWSLHLVRALLDTSGIVRKYKGKFIVSKKGKPFTDEKNAGKLLYELFLGFHGKFNHAYLDRWPETMTTRYAFPFSLRFVHYRRNTWIDRNDFIKLLPPGVLEHEFSIELGEFNEHLPTSIITTRIINPLEMFGLIEKRYIPDPKFPGSTILSAIKSTKLFEEFVRFEL